MAFLVLTALFSVTLFAGVVLIDPYSTGRFALTQRVDIASRHFRRSRVGIARDPRFNAAIVGASSSHALDPQVIGEQTGWRIAQLTVSGAFADEQLMVARAFDRHHQKYPTLVILALDGWCGDLGEIEIDRAENVPAWLYEGSTREYLAHILFPESLATAVRRLQIWLGLKEPAAREDGYDVAPHFWPQRDLSTLSRPHDAPIGRFQGPDLLARHLASLADETRVMLMFGPQYVATLPIAGSPAEMYLSECKQRIRDLAASRPNTGYLDLLTENEIASNPDYFADGPHYRAEAAKLIEQALITAMRDQGLAAQ